MSDSTIQPLRSAIAERIMQRIRYFPWWVMHPIQYHRSESFRRAVEMLARDFIDITESSPRASINVCSEVAWDAGYDMHVTFEKFDTRVDTTLTTD